MSYEFWRCAFDFRKCILSYEKSKRLVSSFIINNIFLTVVKTILLKQRLFSFLINKVRQNLFSFSLSPTKLCIICSKPCVTFVLVLLQWSLRNSLMSFWVNPYVCNNSCLLISDSKIKNMYMNHITNGHLHKRHTIKQVLFVSGKWKL